jgi:hypothetical protein
MTGWVETITCNYSIEVGKSIMKSALSIVSAVPYNLLELNIGDQKQALIPKRPEVSKKPKKNKN